MTLLWQIPELPRPMPRAREITAGVNAMAIKLYIVDQADCRYNVSYQGNVAWIVQ